MYNKKKIKTYKGVIVNIAVCGIVSCSVLLLFITWGIYIHWWYENVSWKVNM
jgi:hypothetical protein